MQMIVWVFRYPGAMHLHLFTLRKQSVDYFVTKREMLSTISGIAVVISAACCFF